MQQPYHSQLWVPGHLPTVIYQSNNKQDVYRWSLWLGPTHYLTRPPQPALAGISFLQQGQEPMFKVNSKWLLKAGTGLVPKSPKQQPVFCPLVCFHVQMTFQAEHPLLQYWSQTVARKAGVRSHESQVPELPTCCSMESRWLFNCWP